MSHSPQSTSPVSAEQLWNEYCDQLEWEPSAQGAISFAFARMSGLAQTPAVPAGESKVTELAAWLIALEDALMYEPVPASLVEHGRRYVHAGLTEKHSGDCTNQCHSCVVCGTSDAIAKAAQILAALSLTSTDSVAQLNTDRASDHPDEGRRDAGSNPAAVATVSITSPVKGA